MLAKNGQGGFAKQWYWSSSQLSSIYAWIQYFGDGNRSVYGKDYKLYVRAVRAF